MYVSSDIYRCVWLHCKINSRQNLQLLGANSQTRGVWVDHGCGQEIFDDESSVVLCDVRENIVADLYLIILINTTKLKDIDKAMATIKLSLLFQDENGKKITTKIKMSEAQHKNVAETEKIAIVSVDDQEIINDQKTVQNILQKGVINPTVREMLTNNLSKYECRRLIIRFENNSDYTWYFPELLVPCNI